MASNEDEVLDPTATVEKDTNTASGFALNRRHFMAALGVAGAAAGIKFATNSAAHAQQPTPNGYSQTDILNFLLNIKYLKATYYSYLTTGADLPAYVTVGTGLVEDIPGTTYTANKITGTPTKLTATAPITQQMIDMLYEMYYDELQQVIDLRNLLGPTVVIGRPRLNLLGTGAPSTTATFTNTLNPQLSLATARMLEDVSATAFAGAIAYLSGANLALASQILASDGYHSGAIRLACIQAQVPYQPTQYVTPFTANMVSTSATPGVDYKIIYPATGTSSLPAVGSLLTGIGIPTGTVVTSTTPITGAATTPTGFIASAKSGSATITNVSDLTGIAVGQYITGTGVATNATIIAHNRATATGKGTIAGTTDYTITMSTTNSAAASPTVAATGTYNSGDKVINNVSSLTSIVPGALVIGSGLTSVPTYVTGTTTIPASGSGSTTLQILLSQAAAGTSITTTTLYGTLLAGTNTITNVSSLTNVVTGTVVGTTTPQKITITNANGGSFGTGTANQATTVDTLTATATIGGVNTITTSHTINAGTTTAPIAGITGIVTSGSPTITFVSPITAFANVRAGQPISCAGMPAGTYVSSTSSSIPQDPTITTTGTAFASSNVTITGIVTPGSAVITNVSSIPANISTALPITGVGIAALSVLPSPTTLPTSISAFSAAAKTITMTSPASGGPSGITAQGSNIITSVSSITGLTIGDPIGGLSLPNGTTILDIGTTSPYTIKISQNAPTSEVGFLTVRTPITIGIPVPLTISQASTFQVSVGTASVTMSTPVTFTIPTASVTMSAPATLSAINLVNAVTADPMDVSPVDPGTPASAAKGPAAATTPTGALDGVTPTVYQGFFNTAGAATSAYGAPSGFAFARTFSQVLQCLYNGTTTTTTQVTNGGFFPSGVGGNITAV